MGIRLKLDGNPLPVCMAAAVRRFLDKASVEDLFTLRKLAQESGLNYTTLVGGNLHAIPELGPYTFSKPGHCFTSNIRRVWGNPKAIEELRKGIA